MGDERAVANDPAQHVQSSLGPPPACTYHAERRPRQANILAVRSTPVGPETPGGRLGSQSGKRAWNSFFGPGGEGHAVADKAATRIAAGWTPELEANPVQEAWQVPRPRQLEPGSDEQKISDQMVVDQLAHNVIEEVEPPTLPSTLPRHTVDQAMIYEPGVPFPVPRTVYAWIHDVFVIPKSTPGKWRWIMAAVLYNLFMIKHKFKQQAAEDAANDTRHGDFFTTYDVEQFFPHVLIRKRFRPQYTFRHRFAGELFWRWYHYRALCFGVHDCPRALQIVMRPILAYLKGMQAIRVNQHVDDGMVQSQTAERCVFDTQTVVDTLTKLHFLVHWDKSVLRPSQLRCFSGMLYDSVRMARRLSVKRIKSVQRGAEQLVAKLRDGKPVTLRLIASTLGRQRATDKCVCIAYLMTRQVMMWQNAALVLQMDELGIPAKRRPIFDDETIVRSVRQQKHVLPGMHWAQLINWDRDVCELLPEAWRSQRLPALLEEQMFWIQELHMWNGKWMSGKPPMKDALMFESDASGYGGGLVVPALGPMAESRHHWLPEEMPYSINWKELAEPQLGLNAVQQQFPTKIRDRLLYGRLDNTTAIAYIQHQGGPQPVLSALALRLWFWLLANGLWLYCTHLAGVLNVRADKASRWRDDRSEWRLSQEAWLQVESLHGPHSVDLFASRRNTQCRRFYSRWLDPDAAACDALLPSRDWSNETNCYAHPPYALIPRVLDKVVQDECEITLVAPLWASQSWIVPLMELSVALPRVLTGEYLMEPVLESRHPPRQPQWATFVWRISGNTSAPKVPQEQLRTALFGD